VSKLSHEQECEQVGGLIRAVADRVAEEVFKQTIVLADDPDFEQVSEGVVKAAVDEFRAFCLKDGASEHDTDVAAQFFHLEIIRGCKRRAYLMPDEEGSA
jgi:hypothetical protein